MPVESRSGCVEWPVRGGGGPPVSHVFDHQVPIHRYGRINRQSLHRDVSRRFHGHLNFVRRQRSSVQTISRFGHKIRTGSRAFAATIIPSGTRREVEVAEQLYRPVVFGSWIIMSRISGSETTVAASGSVNQDRRRWLHSGHVASSSVTSSQ